MEERRFVEGGDGCEIVKRGLVNILPNPIATSKGARSRKGTTIGRKI